MEERGKLRELISHNEISAAVKRLAAAINEDYAGKEPVLVGVLNGSFIFLSDLVRLINMTVEVDFIRASSYGSGTVSRGEVSVMDGPGKGLAGRDVIVVEDIIDTGLTAVKIIDRIKAMSPSSVKVCTLLDKPAGRKTDFRADYVGIEVDGVFIVGYGLDLDEKYRNLKGLYVMEEDIL
ncbi:MAG: hypoxanthine phosphoribosyltransferase [Nitrospirota bacterium]